MSASHRHDRRRRRSDSHGGEHESDERWLLTYADMITLLMALFIVLWAISSVNTSKYAALRNSLQQAFDGKLTEGGQSVLTGGPQVLKSEGASISAIKNTPPTPTKVHSDSSSSAAAQSEASKETESLKELARQVDQYAREHGLQNQIQTQIDERGLVVRLLTDKVLFDSGQAVV